MTRTHKYQIMFASFGGWHELVIMEAETEEEAVATIERENAVFKILNIWQID